METVLQGLADLRGGLQCQEGLELLAAFLDKSPECTELQALWAAQAGAKDDRVVVALLLGLAALVSSRPPPQSPAAAALDRLTAAVPGRRMRLLYSCLGSGTRSKANAALVFMTAVAARGFAAARALCGTLDFDLPALGKVSRPPREKPGSAEAGEQRWHRGWGELDPLKRPSPALFVDFALALLRSADDAQLCQLLTVRPLWAGLLGSLIALPPAAAAQVVAAVRARVTGASASVPPRLRAEPFGDAVLWQLAALSARDADESGEVAAAAAAVAHALLLALCTNPALGLLPGGRDGTGEGEAPGRGGPDHSGQRRLARLLPRLHVAESRAHFDLLAAAAAAQPSLAAAYLAGAPAAEPRSQLRWLASAAAAGRCIAAAAAGQAPFTARARRRQGPPSMDSGLVQALLKRILPPSLPKAALSRGVQHRSALGEGKVEAGSPGEPGEPRSDAGARPLGAAGLAMARLLAVLTGYARCLPEALADARVHPGRLLPQDILCWHPLLQHAALAWLAAAEGKDSGSQSTGLGLGRMAARRLDDVVGFEGNPAEAALWLGLLPCGDAADGELGMCEAVIGFLAEAVALALRVAGSEKMPPDARAGIAAYVAGVLGELLLLHADPAPLAAAILGLLRSEAASQASCIDSRGGSPASGDHPNPPKKRMQLQLPVEAQPLASLAQAAARAAAAADAALDACPFLLLLRGVSEHPGLLTAAPNQARLAAALGRVPDEGRPAAALALVSCLRQELSAPAVPALFRLLRSAMAQQEGQEGGAASAGDAGGALDVLCAPFLRRVVERLRSELSATELPRHPPAAAAAAAALASHLLAGELALLAGALLPRAAAACDSELSSWQGGEAVQEAAEHCVLLALGNGRQAWRQAMHVMGWAHELLDACVATPSMGRARIAAELIDRVPAARERLPRLLCAALEAAGKAYVDALARVAGACMATLAALYRQCTLCAQGKALERQLAGYLDGCLGDALAALPDQARRVALFARLVAGAGALGTAALRHRFEDPAALRTLRRLLAALLPADDGDDENPADVAGSEGSRATARVAAELLIRVVGHSRFVSAVARRDAALPPAAARLQAPLESLLPVVEDDCWATQGPCARRELAELLEVLLDLQARYAPGLPPDALATALRAALPALLVGYGGTLSTGDRALLRAVLLADRRLRAAEESEVDPCEAAFGGTFGGSEGCPGGSAPSLEEDGDGPAAEAAARVQGPLARAGFLWGELAERAHADGLLLSPHPAVAEQTARRAALLEGPAAPDLGYSEAGYDPAFMLPFCVQALRTGMVSCQQLARCGLLALALRALAAADVPMRALAYETLGLATAALESEDFREKPQLVLLLHALRAAVPAPFARLPSAPALAFSEASLALAAPAGALFGPLNKLLLRGSPPDLHEVPLVAQLLAAAGSAQSAERTWLLRLLAAGLRGPTDGPLYRRRFIAERLMALHDSPLADASLRAIALRALCSAAAAPELAADLVLRAGLTLRRRRGASSYSLLGTC
ncbi:hypothetical protein WJX81_003433 [Elliptochloris bilobata]|uniref:Nucleolar pre-ribosomal-associated protein 1 C-terminal domain-containing protein n=1 Tax=Elliptochloris bilobata TaxID=381761 RepID=A0AAW1RTA0_9CHLO